jgi:hypothetical protein
MMTELGRCGHDSQTSIDSPHFMIRILLILTPELIASPQIAQLITILSSNNPPPSFPYLSGSPAPKKIEAYNTFSHWRSQN